MQMNKKILWLLLAIFVSFDNIYSYIAIAYHGMREWNRITAFFVNLNPLFYFISIPLTLLFIYLLIKFSGFLTIKFEKSTQKMREITEKIILTSIIIAWGIGITSFNFVTLLNGFSPIGIKYEIVLTTGIIIAIVYSIYTGYKLKRKK